MAIKIKKKATTDNIPLFSDVIKKDLIKSPLNYIGGKYKILKQILPYFPTDIVSFVDLFAGGCNVGINVEANRVYFNDNLTFLVEMYRAFQNQQIAEVISYIEARVKEFDLSLTNEEGYKKLRFTYNLEKRPLDLFVLIAFTFNHQIRFNNSHEFNNPFGRERSSFNLKMKENLISFLNELHNKEVVFSSKDFDKFDFSGFNNSDFVYCDPPYLITTGTYNDGKRGFTGWGEKEEKLLLEILDNLDKEGIKFGLSNVLEHKGKSNNTLKEWVKRNKYNVNYLDYHYANSNYQTRVRDKKASVEVLITNYK